MPEADSEKPAFRPAQIVSESQVAEAFESDDLERIREALIDGSRCLGDEIIYPHAVRMLNHGDAGVRWAAAFAMGMCRGTIRQRIIDDFEPIHSLSSLASDDADPSVRSIAAQALTDFISQLLPLES